VLDRNKSNIRNSENTALFLVSCYQYILSAIVLSVGKPFRDSMRHNLPFVITMGLALAISSYMLFDPAPWLYNLIQLTWTSPIFKIFILVLALGGFVCMYIAERAIFPRVAKWIGKLRTRWKGTQKKRKEYKLILEDLRI
jgi:cation-transporting ATPase 13A3/4/5